MRLPSETSETRKKVTAAVAQVGLLCRGTERLVEGDDDVTDLSSPEMRTKTEKEE